MARVNFVKKARKDYPQYEIKKGESYYWWKFRFGSKQVSKTQPKRSQLTQSGFLSQIYDIEDRIGNITEDCDFESEIQDIVSELESLRDECEEKRDNMPEQLQDSGSGEILQNRYDSLDEMIDELGGIDLEVNEEDIKADTDREEKETDEEFNEKVEEAIREKRADVLSEIQGVSYNGE